MSKEEVLNYRMQKTPPLDHRYETNLVKYSVPIPMQSNASARDTFRGNETVPTKQTEIFITKHINIIGAPSSTVQVSSWTSVVAADDHFSTNDGSPLNMDSKSPKINYTTTQAAGVFVGRTDESVPTPVESVEFFPKPVNQERRAREKQIISQPVYESIPNSYEKVRRLAGDQQAEQAQSVNVREGRAMGPIKQSSAEAYLGERMLNLDGHVVNTTSNGNMPDGIFQKTMVNPGSEISQITVQTVDPPALNRHMTNGSDRFLARSSAAQQIPLYEQREKPVDVHTERPISADISQCSPPLVRDNQVAGAQVVPDLPYFGISPLDNQNVVDSHSMVKIVPDAEGAISLHSAIPDSADQELTGLQNLPTNGGMQVHNGPVVAVIATEPSVVPDQVAREQLKTRVSRNTVPSIWCDPDRVNKQFDYAPNMQNFPREDEAEVYQIPPGPPLHTGVQSQYHAVDPGQSPVVPQDFDKSQIRTPATTRVTGQSITVAEPSQGGIPLPVHHTVPGAPVPDQRSNVVMLNKDVLETGRAVRTEKLPTNVDRISRTPAMDVHDADIGMPLNRASEHVSESENMLTESAKIDPKIGCVFQQTVPKITPVSEPQEVTDTVRSSKKDEYGLGEVIQIHPVEQLKQLHDVLFEQPKLVEHVRSENADQIVQSGAYSDPYHTALQVNSEPKEEPRKLAVDQPILPGKYQIGDNGIPIFQVNGPCSFNARLAESQLTKVDSQDTMNSIVASQPNVEPSKKPLPLSQVNTSAEANRTSAVHRHADDRKFYIDPAPVRSLESPPKPPVLSRDRSIDQVESYEDSEYADVIPHPIEENRPESRRINERHDSTSRPTTKSISVGIDRTKPIDAVGQMRLKPEKVTTNATLKATAHNGLSQEIQGPSIQFHSGHVHTVPVSDHPQIQRSYSTSSVAHASDVSEMEKMRRLMRYTGGTIPKCIPPVPPELPDPKELNGTSQIRITKETVNRHVEWDWKRNFKTDDKQANSHGKEIGWASMNDAYEVHREVRLYTEGFVPPFTLGDQPQILINLDGRAGVEYNVDFGNPGNFRVGVRANGTTTNVPTSTTTATTSDRGIAQNREDGRVLPNLCLPISRLFPRRFQTTQ